MSRLPLKSTVAEETLEEAVVSNIGQIDKMPVTNQQLERATRKDPTLSKVLHYTQRGWPERVEEELKLYWSRCQEFTIEQNCLLWGIRVVLPVSLRDKVM